MLALQKAIYGHRSWPQERTESRRRRSSWSPRKAFTKGWLGWHLLTLWTLPRPHELYLPENLTLSARWAHPSIQSSSSSPAGYLRRSSCRLRQSRSSLYSSFINNIPYRAEQYRRLGNAENAHSDRWQKKYQLLAWQLGYRVHRGMETTLPRRRLRNAWQ